MSKTPQYDAKVKEILDALEPGERVCDLTGEKWVMEQKEIDEYRRFNVPPSKLSQNTRWKWQAYFDVGYQFWWNKHPETGERLLSFHHPATGVKVLPDKEWYDRDFADIFEDHDSEKPFFNQMKVLLQRAPLRATFDAVPPENSISLFSFGDRNSYFTFACQSARCYYIIGAMNVEDSSLIFLATDISKSHAVIHSSRIYNCRHLRESFDCMDSAFIFDCRNCKNCFGASNKRNKEYIWFNQQLTKVEWEAKYAEVDLGKRSEVEKYNQMFETMLADNTIWPENFNEGSEDSVGDYLQASTRCKNCFDSVKGAVDNYWSAWMYGSPQDNTLCWGAINCSNCYVCVSSPESSYLKFCYRSTRCEDSEYLYGCIDCRNCFGCISLKKKEFCILNKQYSEEEYWSKLDQIKCQMLDKGQYGEYFPTTFSTSYVPECGAYLYAGADPEDIEKLGGNVFDPNEYNATGLEEVDLSQAKSTDDIPDSIQDVGDEWAGKLIYDKDVNRTFAMLKPEIEHYRELNIAPPAEHFILRVKNISSLGQKAQLVNSTCQSCSKEVLVSVNKKYPNRKIYCKKCYLEYLEKYG
jgi:hypothetical protein